MEINGQRITANMQDWMDKSQLSLEEGIPHKVSSISSEFFWEFFLVFLEGLGWLRGSSMGVCEALCDKKGLYKYILS